MFLNEVWSYRFCSIEKLLSGSTTLVIFRKLRYADALLLAIIKFCKEQSLAAQKHKRMTRICENHLIMSRVFD